MAGSACLLTREHRHGHTGRPTWTQMWAHGEAHVDAQTRAHGEAHMDTQTWAHGEAHVAHRAHAHRHVLKAG